MMLLFLIINLGTAWVIGQNLDCGNDIMLWTWKMHIVSANQACLSQYKEDGHYTDVYRPEAVVYEMRIWQTAATDPLVSTFVGNQHDALEMKADRLYPFYLSWKSIMIYVKKFPTTVSMRIRKGGVHKCEDDMAVDPAKNEQIYFKLQYSNLKCDLMVTTKLANKVELKIITTADSDNIGITYFDGVTDKTNTYSTPTTLTIDVVRSVSRFVYILNHNEEPKEIQFISKAVPTYCPESVYATDTEQTFTIAHSPTQRAFDCKFLIAGKNKRLMIGSFDVTPTSCSNFRTKSFDEKMSLPGTEICRSTTTSTESAGNIVWFTYTLNLDVAGNDLKIRYKNAPAPICPESLNLDSTAPPAKAEITNLLPKVKCEWTAQAKTGYRLVVTITEFVVGDDCVDAEFYYYDGTSIEEKRCRNPGVIRVERESVTFRFVATATAGARKLGLTYTQVPQVSCPTSKSVPLLSQEIEVGDTEMKQCTFYFYVPFDSYIQLEFLKLDLDGGRIECYEGMVSGAGEDICPKVINQRIEVSKPLMQFDLLGGKNTRIQMRYKRIPVTNGICPIYETSHTAESTIDIPINSGGFFYGNYACSWIITAPKGWRIQIDIIKILIQDGDACNFYNGEPSVDAIDFFNVKNIESTGSFVTLAILSGHNAGNRNVKLKHSAFDPSLKYCPKTEMATAADRELTIEYFPALFECNWIIMAPDLFKVRFKVKELNLGPDCERGKLTYFDGHTNMEPNELCEIKNGELITISKNLVSFRLKSIDAIKPRTLQIIYNTIPNTNLIG